MNTSERLDRIERHLGICAKRTAEYATEADALFIGYREGVRVKSAYHGHEENIVSNKTWWTTDKRFYMGGVCINYQGRWAEIIQEPDVKIDVKYGLLERNGILLSWIGTTNDCYATKGTIAAGGAWAISTCFPEVGDLCFFGDDRSNPDYYGFRNSRGGFVRIVGDTVEFNYSNAKANITAQKIVRAD